jgi:hypothetical protein
MDDDWINFCYCFFLCFLFYFLIGIWQLSFEF